MRTLPTALFALLAAPVTLAAQANYEIQVYPSETAAPNTTFFELHSNYTAAGTKTEENGAFPTNDALLVVQGPGGRHGTARRHGESERE